MVPISSAANLQAGKANKSPVFRANRLWRLVPFGCCALVFPAQQQEHDSMAREDRFYAFIIAHTSRSRARVQRIRVEKRAVTICCAILIVLAVGLFYGLYGLKIGRASCRERV